MSTIKVSTGTVIGSVGERFPRGGDRDRLPRSAGEITDTTARLYRGACDVWTDAESGSSVTGMFKTHAPAQRRLITGRPSAPAQPADLGGEGEDEHHQGEHRHGHRLGRGAVSTWRGPR